MTARPQDVALLPVPKWVPDPIIGHLLSDVDREFCEQYATAYARANVTAALASAQAREEELRAEVERLREDLGFIERVANHHARKPGHTPAQMLGLIQHYPPIKEITRGYSDGKVPTTPDPYARAERLEEALRDGLSGLNGLFASGDYPLTDEVAELGLAIIEDMRAALSTNAATQTAGEAG